MGRVRISLDPGTITVGVAVWELEGWKDLKPPIEAFSIESNLDNWDERIRSISAMLYEALFDYWIDGAYIEIPQYIESAKGRKAARRNDLVKLSIGAGAYAQVISSFPEGRVKWVPIPEWKGNLSKAQTQARVEKRFGPISLREYRIRSDETGKLETQLPELENPNASDDVWDAVALGLWAKGQF